MRQVIRYFFFFTLVALIVVVGFGGAMLIKAYAGGPVSLPVFYYKDNTNPDVGENELAESWNEVWKDSGHLEGQKISSCSDLERVLAGRPYSYDIDRALGYPSLCPDITMMARITQPQRTLFNSDRPDQDIYRHLDMSSLHWGDLDRRLGRTGAYTLAQLSLKKVSLYRNQVFFMVGERGYQINMRILADFEGKGGQQLYCDLWYYDYKTSENANFPVLLTRAALGGPIIAKPVYVKKPVSFKIPEEVRRHMIDKDPRYDDERQ